MSIESTLNQRQNQHGDFTRFANVEQGLLKICEINQRAPLTAVQASGLRMVLHKVARIIVGDPNHADHWHDIQGYAALVEKTLRK